MIPQNCYGPTQREVLRRAAAMLKHKGITRMNTTNLRGEGFLESLTEQQLAAEVREIVQDSIEYW